MLVLASATAWGWDCTRVAEGATDAFPIGGAIRSAGSLDQVAIAWDVLDKQTALANQGWLALYQCSEGDGCATRTAIAGPMAVGAPLGWGNPVNPALAMRTDGGAAVLRLVLRQKVQPDCDGDGLTADDGDPDDQVTPDLVAYTWDLLGGLSTAADVFVNGGGTCVSPGVSQARFAGSAAHACFTASEAGADDHLTCAVEGPTWVEEATLTGDGGNEDHPSFDLVRGQLVVAGHQKRIGALDSVRVHFPGLVAPPSEPVVDFFSSGAVDSADDAAQFPDLTAGGGRLRLVWQDGAGPTAMIRTSTCDRRSGADCADRADWSRTTDVADASTGFNDGAQLAQIAVDGLRQWLVYSYDADPTSEVAERVVAAERCGDGPWTLAEVRAPDVATDDQSLEFGRPSLALNRDERVAHVLFAEFDDFVHRDDLGGATHDGDLYWCSLPYDPCP